MKKLNLWGFLLVLAAVLCLPNACSAGLMDHPRVAVFPVESQVARKSIIVDEGMLTNIETMVYDDLLVTDMFEMADRGNIHKVLQEQEFSHSALVDPATAAKLGKFIGAQYIVLGAVTGLAKVDGKYIGRVTLRMVEVETAKIALTGMGSAKESDEGSALVEAAEDALHGKRGMISMLKGKRR